VACDLSSVAPAFIVSRGLEKSAAGSWEVCGVDEGAREAWKCARSVRVVFERSMSASTSFCAGFGVGGILNLLSNERIGIVIECLCLNMYTEKRMLGRQFAQGGEQNFGGAISMYWCYLSISILPRKEHANVAFSCECLKLLDQGADIMPAHTFQNSRSKQIFALIVDIVVS
jgi:hypothetical protein